MKTTSISEDLCENTDKLFLFFGGIAGAIGMPPFEFYRSSKIISHSKIFFRDRSQSWYQLGLPDIGKDVFEIAEYLKSKISELKSKDVVLVGNSMGGFAALLFCSMLQRGRVIAFSPQTFISKEKRRYFGDFRWAAQIDKMHQSASTSHIYDLSKWIEVNSPEIKADIHVSTSDALDVTHANQLINFKNVRLNYYPNGGHKLVTKLHEDGLLPMIFRDY